MNETRRSARAPYLGPAARRPMVLDAASELFAEAGYAGTSMRAIAARADISKAVLYDCFPEGKRAIYAGILDRVAERFRLDVIEPEHPGGLEEGLVALVEAVIRVAAADPDGFRIVFGVAGTRDRVVARRAERMHRALTDELRGAVARRLRRVGLTRRHISAAAATAIAAVAEELARVRLEDPARAGSADVGAIVEVFARGLERAL